MTLVFRHPKYYKNLRKLARNSELHVRPIDGGEASDTDQAISERATETSTQSVRPDPGLKHQASSSKLQAFEPTRSIIKRQASSPKQQASSFKP